MIKINLLPPELRKRTSTYNPMVLIGVGEAALCVVLLLFCCYIQWVKIPAAQQLSDDKQNELATKTAMADEVRKNEASIDEFGKTLAELRQLLGRKVYWAHTLDDFCTLMASNFPGGFNVRCLQLDIGPSTNTGEKKADALVYSFRGHYQLVGEVGKEADGIKGMFKHIANSTFWKTHGFTGKPEDTYFGDHPLIDTAISKVIIPFNFEFQRVQEIKKAGG